VGEVGLGLACQAGRSVEYFYEAGSCQAPFFVIGYMSSSLLFVVDRASGFLIREALICLRLTSIRAGLILCQTPNAVFAQRRFWKRRGERPHLTGGSLWETK
jgi:hypothetical protein